MCPCPCHPHTAQHPPTGCCVCCPSREMLDSYDPVSKQFRIGPRITSADLIQDVGQSRVRVAELEAELEAARIDLVGARNIAATQTATIERLQEQNRKLREGRGGWGER